MRIFADSSALVALFRSEDPNHLKALQLAKQLQGNTGIISSYIFAETVTIISQKEGKQQSKDAGQTLKAKFVWTQIDEDIFNLSWEIFQRQKSKNVSFVDCTVFAIYKKGLFDKCFSFDDKFKKQVPLLS